MAHYIIELSHSKEECLQALTTIINLGMHIGHHRRTVNVLAVTPDGYAKLSDDVKKYYHDHAEEVAMGGITLPGLSAEDGKKTVT